MDKETKALIDFYDNKIKDLEKQNKEKQDKLDKINKYCDEQIEYAIKNKQISDDEHNTIMTLGNDILQIIKGEDK